MTALVLSLLELSSKLDRRRMTKKNLMKHRIPHCVLLAKNNQVFKVRALEPRPHDGRTNLETQKRIHSKHSNMNGGGSRRRIKHYIKTHVLNGIYEYTP